MRKYFCNKCGMELSEQQIFFAEYEIQGFERSVSRSMKRELISSATIHLCMTCAAELNSIIKEMVDDD